MLFADLEVTCTQRGGQGQGYEQGRKDRPLLDYYYPYYGFYPYYGYGHYYRPYWPFYRYPRYY